VAQKLRQMPIQLCSFHLVMNPDSDYFSSDDGFRIFRRQWLPQTPAKAIVHIAHGLGEHSQRYEGVAQQLAQHGYHVYAHDHRGHGHTAGQTEELGFFAEKGGWERVVADLRLLLEDERKLHPGLPLILFGHSMGSFMAQHMMYRYGDRFDACILSGSTGEAGPRVHLLRVLAFAERLRLGVRGRSVLMHKISLGNANRAFRPLKTDFDWLSRDPESVARYVADPYCGFVGTTSLWLDLLDGALFIANPLNRQKAPKEMPVYIFAGTKDPVSYGCRALESLVSAFNKAGMADIQYRFYQDGRHEMLNESNRDEVVRDLTGWLESTVSKLTRDNGGSFL
jgi:alpha-beta hydrolase superfamily lysophospholipase